MSAAPVPPAQKRSASWARRAGPKLGVLAVLAAAAIWSFGGVLGKSVGVDGVTLSFWRLVIASGVMAIVALGRRRLPTRTEMRASLLAGLLFGLNLCAFFVTLQYTTVAVALIIGALSPVVALPIAAVFMGERVTAVKVSCALVAVAGVAAAVLTAPGVDDRPTRAVGYMWAVASLAVWVVYLLQTKRTRATVATLPFLTSVTWIATVAVFVVALVSRRELGGQIEGVGWLWTVLLALGPGLTGHGLIAWAQPRVDTSVTAMLTQLEPVGASLVAWALLHERMSVGQSLAMVAVVSALAVLAWSESREGALRLDELPG